jgi:hypothetical protein
MSSESWRIQANWAAGTFRVTAPDGAVYEVRADLETTQSSIPEAGVRIHRITCDGVLLHDGARFQGRSVPSEVDELVEGALMDHWDTYGF